MCVCVFSPKIQRTEAIDYDYLLTEKEEAIVENWRQQIRTMFDKVKQTRNQTILSQNND